jgi:hypothetical protein
VDGSVGSCTEDEGEASGRVGVCAGEKCSRAVVDDGLEGDIKALIRRMVSDA